MILHKATTSMAPSFLITLFTLIKQLQKNLLDPNIKVHVLVVTNNLQLLVSGNSIKNINKICLTSHFLTHTRTYIDGDFGDVFHYDRFIIASNFCHFLYLFFNWLIYSKQKSENCSKKTWKLQVYHWTQSTCAMMPVNIFFFRGDVAIHADKEVKCIKFRASPTMSAQRAVNVTWQNTLLALYWNVGMSHGCLVS